MHAASGFQASGAIALASSVRERSRRLQARLASELTHGAVSRRIASAENWLGTPLFERAGLGVSLTPAGCRGGCQRGKPTVREANLVVAPDCRHGLARARSGMHHRRMTSTSTFRFHLSPLVMAVQGVALAIVLGATSACATSAAPAASQPPQPSVKPAEELRALVGDASCNDASQCRTVAWGSKACGGPQSYIAYSTLRTDTAKLEALAKRHAEAQARDNEASGRVSNCMLVTDPGAQCVAGRCEINKAPAVR